MGHDFIIFQKLEKFGRLLVYLKMFQIFPEVPINNAITANFVVVMVKRALCSLSSIHTSIEIFRVLLHPIVVV